MSAITNLIIKLHNEEELSDAEQIVVLKHQLDAAETALNAVRLIAAEHMKGLFDVKSIDDLRASFDAHTDIDDAVDDYFWDKENPDCVRPQAQGLKEFCKEDAMQKLEEFQNGLTKAFKQGMDLGGAK